MYLKKLEIQGFKSFAARTVLEFLPPKGGRFSVTAVVGPNGSGKSNIVDAIRWVMGEQSVKTLRGKKGEDIIFAGSVTKGKLGMAEVSMVLDNSDKKIFPEYSELTITRRLYRSGESEYLFNGTPSRLFDVKLILAQAQFADESYGIIGQGMIDRLLLSTPAERKDFFDEASGIKEFQMKRHRAALKLSRTETNLDQADALMQEVAPRLKLLSRQVKKLEKRQAVELELREAQELYYSSAYLKNKKEITEISGLLKTRDDEHKAGSDELQNIQTELAELARAESRQDVFLKLQGEYTEAQHEKNELEKRAAVLDGQLHTEYSKRGRQDIAWLENKLGDLKFKAEKITREKHLLSEDLNRLEQKISDLKKRYEVNGSLKTEKMLQISRLQEKMSEGKNFQTSMDILGLTTVRAVLDNKNNFGKIYGTVAELGEVEEKYVTALDVAAGGHLSSVVTADDDVARKAIEYLREKRLGRATFLPMNKIQGRENHQDFEELLNHPEVIGQAMDLIKFKNEFYDIFSFVLGSTLVVKDLAAAQKVGIGRARMVTLDGDLVERQGVMKGGWRHFKEQKLSFGGDSLRSGESNLSVLRNTLDECQKEFEATQAEGEKMKEEIYQTEVDKSSLNNRLEMMSNDEKEVEKEKAQMEKELSFTQMSPEEYDRELKELSKEKEVLDEELRVAGEKMKVLAEKMENFNEAEEEKKRRIFALQDTMQTAQGKLNIIAEARQEMRVSLAKLETRRDTLNEESVNDLGSSAEAVSERYDQILSENEALELADKVQKLKYQLSLIGGIDEEVIAEYEETKERHDFLFTQLEDLRTATEELRKIIIDLDEIMKKKRAAAFKKIKKEFSHYFKILFDGGEADLVEVYEDEMSEEEMVEAQIEGVENVTEEGEEGKKKKKKILSGIEVIANPPGKKIKSLSALSGGERTMTSIALICAVLNCNPSPFVILDEVEAALDEANTVRFTKILSELTENSQFIVITHNRVTMHTADALYGVTMPADGVSRLVSVRMEE